MTSVIHGGALWQPRIRSAADYDSVVAADVNDAWYPPAPRVLETIAEWSQRINHSPDTTGNSLREAILRHCSIPVECIRLGAGSSDLLHHIISACAGPGDEVLILNPTYAEYRRVAELAGATVRTIGRNTANPVSANTKVIAICNPNNPTGAVLSRAELLRIIESAHAETYVVIDEAYIDYAPDESLFSDAPEFENLAVVRTFSKAYAMAGLRVGYAALGSRIRARFDLRGRPPWPVGLLGLRAAEVAFEERCYVEQRVAECCVLKDTLIAGLGVPTVASATHYFLVDLAGTGAVVSDVIAKMGERGIFLRDLRGFGCDKLERFLRITTQGSDDNARIVEAFKEIVRS